MPARRGDLGVVRRELRVVLEPLGLHLQQAHDDAEPDLVHVDHVPPRQRRSIRRSSAHEDVVRNILNHLSKRVTALHTFLMLLIFVSHTLITV